MLVSFGSSDMTTAEPWTLKNHCTNPNCRHEKDSHHEGKHNCLALFCDCLAFRKKGDVDENGPVTPRVALTKPHANTSCTCDACNEWTAQKLKQLDPSFFP
jgi:hypothetical protein